MASITITIPNAVKDRVLDAIAARHGYDSGTDGTKAQFAKSVIALWAKRITVEYESSLGGKLAGDTAEGEIDVT